MRLLLVVGKRHEKHYTACVFELLARVAWGKMNDTAHRQFSVLSTSDGRCFAIAPGLHGLVPSVLSLPSLGRAGRFLPWAFFTLHLGTVFMIVDMGSRASHYCAHSVASFDTLSQFNLDNRVRRNGDVEGECLGVRRHVKRNAGGPRGKH